MVILILAAISGAQSPESKIDISSVLVEKTYV